MDDEVNKGRESLNPNLAYGIDLYRNYFVEHGNTALFRLGYSERLRAHLHDAFQLRKQGPAHTNSDGQQVAFLDTTHSPLTHSVMVTENGGGYKLTAGYLAFTSDVQDPDIQTEFPNELGALSTAVIHMIPQDIDVTDPIALAKQLYDSGWAHYLTIKKGASPGVNPVSMKGLLKSIVSKTGSFQARWMDREKNDLAVKTDIYHRLGIDPGRNIPFRLEQWRKLPETKGPDGRKWLVFGKKPNPHFEIINNALEKK